MEKPKRDIKQRISDEYDVFEHEYELRNPPPIHNVSKKRWMLRLLLAASIIASARHSIPFFVVQFDNLAIALGYAFAVVCMIEVGLVLLGEWIVDDFPDKISTIRPFLSVIAIGLLLVVAIGGNLVDGFETKELFIEDNVKTSINAVANITAPMMALIIGIMYASLETKIAELDADYQVQKARAWNRHKRKIEIDISVSTQTDNQTDTPQLPDMSENRLSTQTDTRQTGAGYSRASTAVENARQWLLDNPDKMDETLRNLEEMIPGAAKDSISKAKKIIKSNGDLSERNQNE